MNLLWKKFHVLNTVNIVPPISRGKNIGPAIKGKYTKENIRMKTTDVIAWDKGHWVG